MFSRRLLCTVIKYKHCFGVQLHLEPLLSCSVAEVAPYLAYQHFRRTKLGGTGWGSYIWCFSCRNRESALLNHRWNHSPLKNMHKNTKTKSLSDTYAAWSLGSPAPPACVAAGASTAALHDSREREEKEIHQCKKQLKRHFQTHLVLFFGCQGTSEQQNKKTPPPTLLPCPAAIAEVASSSQVSVFCCGQQGEEVAQGLGRVIKIRKASPVSQFFLEHQLLSKPLILKKQTKRNTSWQSSNKQSDTQLLMTPEDSNYHVQIKLIWQNYWSLL